MTQDSDKALEEKARAWERQCWGEGPGLGRSDYEALLVLLREVAEEAKREEAAEWEPVLRESWELLKDARFIQRGDTPGLSDRRETSIRRTSEILRRRGRKG